MLLDNAKHAAAMTRCRRHVAGRGAHFVSVYWLVVLLAAGLGTRAALPGSLGSPTLCTSCYRARCQHPAYGGPCC